MIPQRNDLDWLAFQYLANELSDAQRSAFEDQLATDQNAREALARSVELTQAVVAAEQTEHVVSAAETSDRDLWQPIAWLASTIALCLSFVLVYQRVTMKPPVAEQRPVSIAEKESQLALNWVDTFDKLGDQQNEDVIEVEEFDESIDEPAFMDPPDWMFAAVEGLADEEMDDDKEMMESTDNES